MTRELALAQLYQRELYGADYQVFTSEMVPDKTEGAMAFHPLFANQLTQFPETTVFMVGSSTIEDLHGDFMDEDALASMTEVDDKLSIWMNHDYTLPGSLFGSLLAKPALQKADKVVDLYLAADTETTNAPAMQTYGYIKKGRRIGCSGGFKVLDYDVAGDEDDFFAPLIIHKVKAVEWSTVGIPANQRSWVENAAYGLFVRSIIEDRGEAALRLAPIVRGLFPRPYRDVTRALESSGLRSDLEHARIRPQYPSRLLWDAPRRVFTLSYKGESQDVDRAAIAPIITKAKEELARLATIEKALSLPEGEEAAELEDIEKGACGKTSWGLMDKGTSWSGSKARGQIFAYANGSVSKAKGCFMFYNGDGGSKDEGPDLEEADGGKLTQGNFKLPFCYVSGSPKIVFNGAKAIANVLMGGRGGVKGLSDADKSSVKSKVSTIYRRFAETPPWAKADGKDFDPDRDLDWEGIEDVDIEEIEGLLIEASGTHAPTKGTHLHMHPAYGSTQADGHSHSHGHNNDNNHNHHGAGSKELEGEDEVEEKASVPINADGNHQSFNGSHTHHHMAYGNKADGSQHTHTHAHSNDTNHKHSHDGSGGKELSFDPADQVHQNKLSIVNMLLTEIGLPALETDDAGIPILTFAASVHDRLLGMGQQVHNLSLSLHPAACPAGSSMDGDGTKSGTGSVGTNYGQSVADASAQAQSNRDTMQQFSTRLETMVKDVKDFVTASGVQQSSVGLVTTELETVRAAMKAAMTEVETLRTKASNAFTELEQQIHDLRHRPVGRPSDLHTRVVPESPAIPNATYEDMLAAGSTTASPPTLPGSLSLHQAKALTRRVTLTMAGPGGETYKSPYREWPAGLVPQGGRPPLSGDEISMMTPADVMRYQQGGRALVPLVDDAEDELDT